MPRAFSKKTELLTKVYDHDKHKYLTGYRGLTLGWSDGNTFLPVNFAKNYRNLLGRNLKVTQPSWQKKKSSTPADERSNP